MFNEEDQVENIIHDKLEQHILHKLWYELYTKPDDKIYIDVYCAVSSKIKEQQLQTINIK
ncbi:MAG: hypothetical protein HKO92_11435 [Flavobacteriaceae bacterium]|nr:hypothetical protein [Flavobacteriaceae bacterium]